MRMEVALDFWAEKNKTLPQRFRWMVLVNCQFEMKEQDFTHFYELQTNITAFDCQAKRIENGVYLGPLGCLTFEGRFSWKKRILAFIFEKIRIKVGPLNPFEINIRGKDDSEPSNKNPFFVWFYIDEEIAVARGRSGGTAVWCRCQRALSWFLTDFELYASWWPPIHESDSNEVNIYRSKVILSVYIRQFEFFLTRGIESSNSCMLILLDGRYH